MFGINFAYPGDMAEARRKAAAEKAAQIEAEKTRQRLDVECFYGRATGHTRRKAQPRSSRPKVSDNGETTAFRFPGNTPQPAIYQMTPDGKEQIATPSRCGDDCHCPRHGAAGGCAWATRSSTSGTSASMPVGQNPFTGTTSPEVVRSIKEPSRERAQ